MEKIILKLILTLASLLLSGRQFDNIRERVGAWDDKLDPDGVPLSGDEKFTGVTQDLAVIGVNGAQWLVETLIQLAVTELRVNSGKLEENNEAIT